MTGAAMPVPAPVPGPGGDAGGSIYDIGYRHYEGPRLGRAHALRSLFRHSLASTYGIGRGTRAKIAPLALGGLSLLPAIAIVGALAFLRQFPGGEGFESELPIRYDTYFATISTFIMFFCAAQAPELFGRDQRHSLLTLYFARALRRSDYALSRIAGFMVALLILQLVPQLVLFLGRIMLSPDIPRGVADDLPSLGRALVQSSLAAGLLGGLSMAIAAFTPRRAYAIAAIIALFVIPNIVAGIVAGLGSREIGSLLTLLSPTAILDGTNLILFDPPPQPFEDFFLALPAWAYFAAAGLGIVGSVLLAIRRFSRIPA